MKDVFERALSLQNIDKIIAIIDCVEFVPNLTANAAVFPIDAARLDRLQNRQKYQTIRDILAQIVDVVIVAVAVNDFELALFVDFSLTQPEQFGVSENVYFFVHKSHELMHDYQ